MKLKYLTMSSFGLFLLGVGLFLVQLWAHPWSADLFAKLIITIGALFGVVFVLSFIIRENKISKKINDDGALD